MPVRPVRLEIVRCAACRARIEVYRRRNYPGQNIFAWRIRDIQLCKHRLWRSCPQARIEVGRLLPSQDESP